MKQDILDWIFAKKDGVRTIKHYGDSYTEWHHTLGEQYYRTDIDHVEFRSNRGIVALIDTTARFKDEAHLINSKPYVWERSGMQREILTSTSKALGVPAYFVLHTDDLTIFHVHDLSRPLIEYTAMDEPTYRKFIMNL